MTQLPTWKTIAGDLDAQGAYLLRRCLVAEGKDPNDRDAMAALMTEVQETCPYTRR